MPFRALGKIGIKASILGFGCMIEFSIVVFFLHQRVFAEMDF